MSDKKTPKTSHLKAISGVVDQCTTKSPPGLSPRCQRLFQDVIDEITLRRGGRPTPADAERAANAVRANYSGLHLRRLADEALSDGDARQFASLSAAAVTQERQFSAGLTRLGLDPNRGLKSAKIAGAKLAAGGGKWGDVTNTD
jgi:hypothetical protein